jgi:hypothetical protein
MSEPSSGTAAGRASWPEPVMGSKYVLLLEKELRQLRSEGDHGNRRLFLDDVFIAYLLAFFNPAVRSLRTIEDFSQSAQVQKHLSLRKIARSTLSDFNQLADPARLEPILQTLRRQFAQLTTPADGDLVRLLDQAIAVDGTFLPAAAEVAWAVCNKNNHGALRHRARLDVHLGVQTWLPEAIVVPAPGQSEADSAAANLRPDRLYLYDRGFMSFALLAAHYDQDAAEPRAHFVARYRPAGKNSPTLQEAETRLLSEQDRAAGLQSDRIGIFTTAIGSRRSPPAVQFREIVVACEERGQPSTLRLVTNLLDTPAHVVATLYRSRWQVELFFRWLKSYANFGQLISHSRAGMEAHLYVTIIGVMLMYLHTGYRPSKYLFALLPLVAAGSATLDEILPILRERERQCELARQSAARRRARRPL